MQFCHLVTYDRVLRTISRQSRFFVRSFEIRNLTCTICVPRTRVYTAVLNFYSCSTRVRYTLFCNLGSTESVASAYYSCSTVSLSNLNEFEMQKRLLLFYRLHQQLHSDLLGQPTRFPGTAGVPVPMTDSLTTRTNRIQNHAPDNRTHAAVNPPVSNFWCATMSAHQNPDPADQGLSGAAQDTKGPPTCSQDT